MGSLMTTPAISGRIAVQYFGNRSADGFATSTPSVLGNLNIPGLFGTGMSFTVHGRVARELAPASSMTSGRSRTNVRLYEMALRSDVPGNGLGFALGRVTPRYAAGLGPIDGVEAFVHTGRFTAGILGGLQPDYINSGIDTYRQKAALFVNYGWQNDESGGGDVSVAYGRLMYKGKLDRDFVYLQSSMRIGSTLFLYQSTEIDMTGLDGTERTSKPRLTNTFVNPSYSPVSWLSLDGGYDATRMVYYLRIDERTVRYDHGQYGPSGDPGRHDRSVFRHASRSADGSTCVPGSLISGHHGRSSGPSGWGTSCSRVPVWA